MDEDLTTTDFDSTRDKLCWRCGKMYTDYPALSRTDNKTPICSPCGTDEAMEDWAGPGLTPQHLWWSAGMFERLKERGA